MTHLASLSSLLCGRPYATVGLVLVLACILQITSTSASSDDVWAPAPVGSEDAPDLAYDPMELPLLYSELSSPQCLYNPACVRELRQLYRRQQLAQQQQQQQLPQMMQRQARAMPVRRLFDRFSKKSRFGSSVRLTK